MGSSTFYERFQEAAAPLLPEAGGAVILGLSGGLDSVCLFHLLLRLAKAAPFHLHAHHQQHLIRGEESLEDQRFVEALCEAEGVPLHVSTDNLPRLAEKANLEEVARQVRQQNWEALAVALSSEYPDVRIVTAHHADDQAETILLHLERGSGLSGLGGMKTQTGRLIRPLLGFSRSELLELAQEEGWTWREDSTNLDASYRRNFLRTKVLPLWQSEADPGLQKRLASSAQKVQALEAYLANQVNEALEGLRAYPTEPYYPAELRYYSCSGLAVLEEVLQPLVLREAARAVGLQTDLEEVHLLAMAALAKEGQGEKELYLPHGYLFVRNRSYFCLREEGFKANLPLVSEALDVAVDGEVRVPGSCWRLLFLSEVPEGLRLRTPQTGDFIRDKDGKKVLVKDWYSEHGVPKAYRWRSLWLASGQELLSSYLIHDKSVNIRLEANGRTEWLRLLWYNSENNQ